MQHKLYKWNLQYPSRTQRLNNTALQRNVSEMNIQPHLAQRRAQIEREGGREVIKKNTF